MDNPNLSERQFSPAAVALRQATTPKPKPKPKGVPGLNLTGLIPPPR